jgi:hypothetical protein
MAASGGYPRAVAWTNFLITDLNGWVFGPHDWALQIATGINSNGDIVCNGTMSPANNPSHGVYLTPFLFIPPPPQPDIAKVPGELYFNWFAYHFWWLFSNEFSVRETKDIQTWLVKNGWTKKMQAEKVFADELLLGQLAEFSTLIKNEKIRSRVRLMADKFERER